MARWEQGSWAPEDVLVFDQTEGAIQAEGTGWREGRVGEKDQRRGVVGLSGSLRTSEVNCSLAVLTTTLLSPSSLCPSWIVPLCGTQRRRVCLAHVGSPY